MNIRSLAIAVTISLQSFGVYAQSDEMVACIDDHPPYQHLGANPYGIHIDALKTLANALGKQLSYVQSPNFARCVALLASGEVDVIAGLNINEERKKFAFYAPFKSADKRIVIAHKSLNIDKYDDFKGKIIGVPRGTTYFKKFDNDENLNKVSIHTVRTGLELLQKKRIDLIITSHYVIETLLDDIENTDLTVSDLNLKNEQEGEQTHFGFSKKNKLNMPEQEIILKATEAFNTEPKQ